MTEKEKEKEKRGVEILVHTSAPSRGKDDAHYRALASAYLLFEPVSRTNLRDGTENGQFSASEANVDSQPRAVLLYSTPEEARQGPKTIIVSYEDNIYDVSQFQDPPPPKKYLRSSNVDRAQSLESPQASFSSVLDNLNSPILRRLGGSIKTPPLSAKRKTDRLVASNESSWETPPTVIPDSQSPYNRINPEFSSPTRILKLYLQHFETTESVADTDEDLQRHYASSNILLDSSQPQCSSPLQMTPAVTPSSVEEFAEIIRDTPIAEHRGNMETSRYVKQRHLSLSNATTLSGAGGETGITESYRYHIPAAEPAKHIVDSPARLPPQTSPSHKRRKVEASTTKAKPAHVKQSKRPLQARITPHSIHPPPPRTSSWGPKPYLITPALQFLAAELELPRRYRPRSQTRPVRDLERGFWAVDMGTWPSAVREHAWVALSAYLGQGRAGWGVWGVRFDSKTCLGGQHARGFERSQGNFGNGNKGGEQTGLRIYCWGGVVGHVYLLLHLASERRVKGTGATWVDGGGEVVVRMP